MVIALAEGEPARTVANTFAAVLTYTTNWALLAGVSIERHLTHLWSLAIEEQFYAVWPLLLLGVLAPLGAGPSCCGSRWAWRASALWRAALWESGHSWERLYLRTDARADSLLVGAALAQLPWRRLAAVSTRWRSVAGGVALVALLAAAETLKASSAVLYLGGYTVVAILAAVLIAAVLPGGGVLAATLGAAALRRRRAPVLLAVPVALPALHRRRRAHGRVADRAARRRRLGADLRRRRRVATGWSSAPPWPSRAASAGGLRPSPRPRHRVRPCP